MVRVLHVSQPTVGGVGHYVAGLVADQVSRGWDVAVACPTDGQLAAAVGRAGATHLPWRATRAPGPAVGREARELSCAVRGWAPNVVHLHSSKAGLAGRLALRGRRPTLFQPHGWSWLAVRGPVAVAATAWERASARWCERIVCVSDAERAAGMAAGVDGRWVVVRTGADPATFRPRPAAERPAIRRRLGLGGEPLAVCVGRLSRAKGQDRLVAAWPTVRERVPDARLALVGGGELEATIRPLAGPGVLLVGDRCDVADWYAAADVVVVPSRWDALSLAMVEAAASGCCVVATDVPGVREVLGNAGGRGAVVAPGREEELVDAIVARLADPITARTEGAALARFARTHLDRRQTYAALAELTIDTATVVVPK